MKEEGEGQVRGTFGSGAIGCWAAIGGGGVAVHREGSDSGGHCWDWMGDL